MRKKLVVTLLRDGHVPLLVFAGYSGWGAGQLESELQDNGWICCPTDPDILFDTDFATKYSRALQRIGIDAGRLSAQAGHA
jgi:putative transcriptional regulator